MSVTDESDAGERIFAWHVLPIDKETSFHGQQHLQILKSDDTARVILYCPSHVISIV